ncbi:MAG: hypothetical protein ACSHX0_12715 [Akkermansiaceae bacterium]
MKTNSSAPRALYIGLDVHKAETVIAILESDRDAEARHYDSIATTQHALERATTKHPAQQPPCLLRGQRVWILDRAAPPANSYDTWFNLDVLSVKTI